MTTISRGPQNPKDISTNKARAALADPTVSPDRLREIEGEVLHDAAFLHGVTNIGIAGLTTIGGGLLAGADVRNGVRVRFPAFSHHRS